ncbi:MAG TPA: hypothetical protein VH877_24870 [Polyangia bacterium]|jgi:hypothetical protein|nr:hypothetical protein [Polyangia bacterium]
MTHMTHVDKLVHAGLLDPSSLTEQQKDLINCELSDEEVEVIIKAGRKLQSHPQAAGKRVAFAF